MERNPQDQSEADEAEKDEKEERFGDKSEKRREPVEFRERSIFPCFDVFAPPSFPIIILLSALEVLHDSFSPQESLEARGSSPGNQSYRVIVWFLTITLLE